ncbi:MAG: 30S ribosomal protein S12 methylthiotransferase RimO [Anaerolineae bacterium]|nr:30S ribosomal protein S12 methylthiotransferase RimO [Anaerolineae bacterium]
MPSKSVSRIRSAPRFCLISLGCPKNTVDSSGMAFLLQRAGYRPVAHADQADVIIVNTCGFIADARRESLETLQSLAANLREDQRLIAAGCWAQRDPERLMAWVPELDGVLGTRSWVAMPELLAQIKARRQRLVFTETRTMALPESVGAPGYAISGRSAFLKIADGCSRRCAFCAIPLIKGDMVSRPIEAIVKDAQRLRDKRVLEFNLIAQDSTTYGRDLGYTNGLAELLERLVAVLPESSWLRILYMFPGQITPRLIEVMATYPQVLPYVDLPLQHAHPDVLRRMNRPSDMQELRRTLAELRARLPHLCLRTTLIAGFPGETEAEFQTLLDFVQEQRFDRLGVFTYSHEEGTLAARYEDDVPEAVKEARFDALMTLQQGISLERNREQVGRVLPVLLEGTDENLTVGRSYRDAPEIDGLVLIQRRVAKVDRMALVKITQALEYDLIGELVDETEEVAPSST